MISTGGADPGCGYPRRVTAVSGRVGDRRFRDRGTHAEHAIHLAALLHQEHRRREVPVHHRRGLDLDALGGGDAAPHFPADDGFPGLDVALDEPALGDQHLTPDEHIAFGRLFGKLEGHPNLALDAERPEFFELRAESALPLSATPAAPTAYSGVSRPKPNSSATERRTRSASSVTSGPIPSPGSTATV